MKTIFKNYQGLVPLFIVATTLSGLVGCATQNKSDSDYTDTEPTTISLQTQTGFGTLSTDVKVSEKNDKMQFQMNEKTLSVDKNLLFDKECEKAYLAFGGAAAPTGTTPRELDQEIGKQVFNAYYIYRYKTLFVDWCAPVKMDNYLKAFNARFGQQYKTAINYLDSKADNKAEKCFLQPTAKSRRQYEYKEFDAMYQEVKQSSGAGNYFTKADFCNLLNSYPEARNEIFDVWQDSIRIMNNLDMPTTISYK